MEVEACANEGVIRDLGSSPGLVDERLPAFSGGPCAGGNLSEERFSPRPPSKDFLAAVPAGAGTAVTVKKFLKGGRL